MVPLKSTHQDLQSGWSLDMVCDKKSFDLDLDLGASFKVIDLSKVAYHPEVGALVVLQFGTN